jgi:hypothetical protein
MSAWGSFERTDLEARGFSGFLTVADLRTSRCDSIPRLGGVYVVYRTAATAPTFLELSAGGHFKGHDPTVPVAALKSKWIKDARTMYIGKAGTSTLQTRIRQLLDYGAGRPVGHQGGRYLWQLAGSERLLIAWRADHRPTALENEMIIAFAAHWGAYPFANIAGPRG